jgi:hypothetical protein
MMGMVSAVHGTAHSVIFEKRRHYQPCLPEQKHSELNEIETD